VRAGLSTEEVAWTTRMVVGPDEPPDGMTHEQMAAGHWGHLAAVLRRHGATVTAPELERLPHDVLLSDRLRAWLTAGH
jgi:hypothetical protein